MTSVFIEVSEKRENLSHDGEKASHRGGLRLRGFSMSTRGKTETKPCTQFTKQLSPESRQNLTVDSFTFVGFHNKSLPFSVAT